MQRPDYLETLETILKNDQRYHRDAYLFLREALDYTQNLVRQKNKSQGRHVSGQELLAGIRDYGLSQFGPMTQEVFASWGVHRCEDFGEIVFNLVDHSLLNKTAEDTRDDFKGAYDFARAFREPFLPEAKKSALNLPNPSQT